MNTDIPEMDLSTAEAIARQVVAAKGEGASWRVVGPLLRELDTLRTVRKTGRSDLFKVERGLRELAQHPRLTGSPAEGRVNSLAEDISTIRREL